MLVLAMCIAASRPSCVDWKGIPASSARATALSQKRPLSAHAVRHVSPCGAQNHPAVGGDAGGGGVEGGMKVSQKHSRAKLGTAN